MPSNGSRLAERVEKRREVVKAARQHRGAIVETPARRDGASERLDHLLRRIAGDDARAARGEKRGVEAGAAADLEHAASRREPARETPRACAAA